MAAMPALIFERLEGEFRGSAWITGYGDPRCFITLTGTSVASDLIIGQTRVLGQNRSVSHSVRPSICRVASPAGRLSAATAS